MEYFKKNYNNKIKPIVTVYTPLYNRRNTIKRTIDSVTSQTFKNFEYIIVDDGSTDSSDDIIFNFMETTTIPVLYIKKENGGVHTARNEAIKNARGKYCICIDSDDELTPDALTLFVNAWKKIDNNDNVYRDVVALCKNEKGELVGEKFPSNINNVDKDTAHLMCYKTAGEHVGMDLTSIRKNNLFPEPKGVKFITEDSLWKQLDNKYKTFYINDAVRIYHTEGNDHLSNSCIKTNQKLIDMLWNTSYFINNDKLLIIGIKKKLITMIRYITSKEIIKRNKIDIEFDFSIKNKKNVILMIILWIPSYIYSFYYEKKRCIIKK